MTFADRIADRVLLRFAALPAKSRPICLENTRGWTVLAGIVLTSGEDVLDCVALATGMRCLPQNRVSDAQGITLHDWHAEVLALRLLNVFLLDECRELLQSNQETSRWVRRRTKQERTEGQPQPFALLSHLQIHLYCSEAPCGDASMELTMRLQGDATPWPTPAAPSINGAIDDPGSESPLMGRGYFSDLGVVRRKPGRADSPPTLSKSCSDKLAMRQFTSLLCAPAAHVLVPDGIYFSTLVMPEAAFVEESFRRAFSTAGRLSCLADLTSSDSSGGYKFCPFRVMTTSREFAWSRTSSQSKGGGVSKSSNVSAAWTPCHSETLIRGILQGRKQGDARGASVASRSRVSSLAIEVLAMDGSRPQLTSYSDWKRAKVLQPRQSIKQEAISRVLKGWVTNVEDDFEIAVK